MATGATVTWTSDNVWSTPITDQAGNRRLMKGYLDTGLERATTVTVTGLPAGAYDVYVYALGGHSAKGGEYTVGNVGPLFLVGGGDMDNGPFTGKFVQAAGTDPGYGADDFGNYLVFKGFTGGVVTITATNFFGNNPRAPINGVQLVATTGQN